MRLTVNVLALTAENAQGPYQAEALAAFKQRNFAIPVRPDDTFEQVWHKIEERYTKNYLEPQQAAFFTIKKLQDGWDCDLDLTDTVGSIFSEKDDQKDRVIKVIPSFVNRVYSMPVTSNLRPNSHKRARESSEHEANKRMRQEAELQQLGDVDPARDRPVGSIESHRRVNEHGVGSHSPGAHSTHRSIRSQSGASLIVVRETQHGVPEFGAHLKEESPELGMPAPRAIPESPAISFKKPSVPASKAASSRRERTSSHQEPIEDGSDLSAPPTVRDPVLLLNSNRSGGRRTYGRRSARTNGHSYQWTESDESQSKTPETARKRGGGKSDKSRSKVKALDDGPFELPSEDEVTSEGKKRHEYILKKMFPNGIEGSIEEQDQTVRLNGPTTPVTARKSAKQVSTKRPAEQLPTDTNSVDLYAKLKKLKMQELAPFLAARHLTPKHNGKRTKEDQIRRIIEYDQQHARDVNDTQSSPDEPSRSPNGESPIRKRRGSSEEDERAEEQAVEEILGADTDSEMRDKIETRSKSASVAHSARSSPVESRQPARWLSPQTESDEESVASRSRSRSRAGSDKDASSKDSSDGSSDESEVEDENLNKDVDTVEVNDTAPAAATDVPPSSPPVPHSSHSTAVVPATQGSPVGGSQPLPQQEPVNFAGWLSATQPTPPTMGSDGRAARASASRIGYKSLRTQLKDVKGQSSGGANANRTQHAVFFKTGNLANLGKNLPNGMVIVSDDDDESSSSSSSEDG
ncbi:hypothetical protein N0V90_003066 [Kalmusia sp. IMI 367209]|nr:hypothetical protein N0V90_003066 [Kalmusia sp. IMI 367209]